MGNKSTTHKNKKSESLETPIKPPPISQSSFEFFLQCFHNLPFTLTEDQFENLIYDLEEKFFNANTVVLKSGQPALGIFVIVDGYCNVLASDGLTVINQLKRCDIFGEISSLYNVACTCTVQVDRKNECHVLYLEFSKIKNMIHANSNLIPMGKWFIEQSYIDSTSLFQPNEISRIVIKNQMLQCPFFHNWSDNAIYHVYDQLQKENIEIYQPGVCISFQGDEEIHIIILLKGTVELIRNEKHIAFLSSKDGCFCFHDESLFIENAKHLFTIKSSSTCQMVTFTQEHFQSVIENFALESSKLLDWCHNWKTFYENTDKEIMDRHPEQVYYPLLMCTLKKSELFSLSSHSLLYRIILGMVFKAYDENCCILEVVNDNTSHKNIIVLLKGNAKVFDGSQNHQLSSDDLFYFQRNQSGTCKYIKTTTECVVGFIAGNLIQNVRNDFPESFVNLKW